ncbi:MAG: DUF2125 domain-containing protein [Rhodospirillales bacterium]
MIDVSEQSPVHPGGGKSPRRMAWWILGGCGVLVAAYTGYWFFLAQQLRAGAAQWIKVHAQEGIDIRHEGDALSGFPLAVRLTLRQPVAASDDKRRPFVWRGQRAAVSIAPWRPATIKIAVGGAQELGVVSQGKTTTWRGQARRADLSISGALGGSTMLKMRLEALDMAESAHNRRFRIEHGRLDFTRKAAAKPDEKTPSRTWSLSASGVQLPETLSLPLGHVFSRIVFDGSLLGEPPRTLDPRQLLAWRDAGGTLDVKALEVVYGPLDLKTDGTVALDEQLQPVGAFTAKVQGFIEVIGALRARNLIKPNAALTASLVLGALAKSPAPGERPRLDIALSVQNSKFYVGPVPLAKVPFIRWEAMAP